MKPVIKFSERALEAIANSAIMAYDPSLINGQPRSIPIENIMEQQGLAIEYQYLRKNGELLGEMVFTDGLAIIYSRDKKGYDFLPVKAGTVLIDGTLSEERTNGRLRFTEAHELAHWLLHKKIYSGSGESAAYSEICDNALEWQANYLSSALLMPMGQVKKCFYRTSVIDHTSSAIIDSMAKVFDVSKQAMKIRLESHKLI